jgi:hypothetical protein
MNAKPSETSVIAAHKHCTANRDELISSDLCGCFYCLEIFGPGKIVEWIDEIKSGGKTAVCPFCRIDSVIGSKSGFPITQEFLGAMQSHWF